MGLGARRDCTPKGVTAPRGTVVDSATESAISESSGMRCRFQVRMCWHAVSTTATSLLCRTPAFYANKHAVTTERIVFGAWSSERSPFASTAVP